MSDVQEQMDRLAEARQKVEEFSSKKSRLTGELETHRKRLTELEERSKTEFECTVEDLPEVIAGFKNEAEKALQQAEVTLGLREAAEADTVPKKAPRMAPKASPAGRIPVAAPVEAQEDDGDVDEDALV